MSIVKVEVTRLLLSVGLWCELRAARCEAAAQDLREPLGPVSTDVFKAIAMIFRDKGYLQAI